MSQYPPPYPPAPPSFDYYHPQQLAHPFAAARRAGVMMFVVSGLMLLSCACLGALSSAADWEKLIADASAKLPPEMANVMTAQTMKAMSLGLSVVGVAAGVVLLVLAIFVRRGGRAAIIGSIVFTGMLLAPLSLMILSSATKPAALAGAIMLMVPLAVLVAQLVMLISAARGTSSAQLARQQMQAQYWQYQAQQQGYSPPSYGYATQPPPPDAPPADVPPPPPGQPPVTPPPQGR